MANIDQPSAPPAYHDIGKAANDLFARGYGFGNVKMSLSTKAESGVKFKSTGTHHNDSGRVSGTFETKYFNEDYGLTFTETWNTENVLGTNVSVEDQMLEGLKLGIDTTFSPSTGRKTARVKTAFKHEYINIEGGVDFDYSGPSVFGSAVLGYEGWLAGYQVGYDTAKGKVTTSNFALGYASSDFTLTSFINEGQEFCGSLHHKLTDDTEVGAKLSWASGSNTTSFGIGAKHMLSGDDKKASVRVKVNNRAQIGLGYTQSLRDGINLTLSGLVDAKNLNQPGHKLGMSLDFEA
eukprot:m.306105 g.306105  ORF g.306105 m.306105 type:complete len:293 (+) comp40970_c0_seq1:69-947(+)